MVHTPQSPQLITVTSGKGGVGKTSFTLNLAFQLAKLGKKVLVVDADTGLANIDIQLNIHPTSDLGHVLAGEKQLAEALTPTPHNFSVLCGRSGHAGLANLPLPTLTNWLKDLRSLTQFTHILLDAPAGVASTTLALGARSDTTLLLTTPDPSSLTDAYALIKLTHQAHGTTNIKLVTNQSTTFEATQTNKRLGTAVSTFLGIAAPTHLATVPTDRHYASAIKLHQLASVAYPTTAAVKAIATLARTL